MLKFRNALEYVAGETIDEPCRQGLQSISKHLSEAEYARERMVARINGNCIAIYDDYDMVLNQLHVLLF